MNKFLKILKIGTIIFLIGTLGMFLIGIIFPHVNEILLFEVIAFFCFTGCLYLFFVLHDIHKKRISGLKYLNIIGLLASFLTFVYWGIIKPNAYGLAIATEIIFFVFCNLIVITIINFIIKKELKTILKEWKLFILIMLCFIIWGIVNYNYE